MWFRRALPWLLALAIAANLFELASLTVLPWNGVIRGVDFAPTNTPFTTRLARVDKHFRALGFMPGDLVDSREEFYANGSIDSINGGWLLEGKPYVIVAHRGNRTIRASAVPEHSPIPWDYTLRLIAVFWVLAFAFLIFKKGRAIKENDYLTLILVLLALESPIGRTAIPYNAFAYVYEMLGAPAFKLMCFSLAVYGIQFRTPVARSTRVLFYLSLGATMLSWLQLVFALTNVFVSPMVDVNLGAYTALNALSVSVPLLFGLLTIADAIRYARPTERQRLAWVVAAFIPWFIGATLGEIMVSSSGWFAVQNVSFFFIPAALTYAALSRRLFDIGFVLNRAAVFAGVSAIVVGAFVLLEWALGQWFEGLSHASSLAINGGLALVIGVSFRMIHQYVDRTVDTIFFRKRHENETALRRFAREAAFLTSEDALLAQTTATILDHSDVSTVRILSAAQLDANDPAVAAMKAWQESVDLTKRATSIEGELAFPMLAHGALVGAIVCGAKKNGEHFAPDEMETLQTVAHGVGLALDGLNRSSPAQTDAIDLIARRLEALTRHLGIDDTLTVTE